MCYADTSYVLALLRQVWCSDSAGKVKEQINKESLNVWGSEITFYELLVDAYNENLDPMRYIRNALSFIEPRGVEPQILLKAAKYMANYDNGPADSLHLAYSISAGARLITADQPIKETLKSIPNTPKFINLRSPNPRV